MRLGQDQTCLSKEPTKIVTNEESKSGCNGLGFDFIRPASPVISFSDSAISDPPKHNPFVTGHYFTRAQSEPRPQFQQLGKLPGRLKNIRPKSLKDFSKGCIHSWDDFEDPKRVLKKSQCVFAKESHIDPKNTLARCAIKVYSKKRNKSFPINSVLTSQDCNILEDFNEGMESIPEGDNQMLRNFDSSSMSSYSDSEESYHSNKGTEKRLDL